MAVVGWVGGRAMSTTGPGEQRARNGALRPAALFYTHSRGRARRRPVGQHRPPNMRDALGRVGQLLSTCVFSLHPTLLLARPRDDSPGLHCTGVWEKNSEEVSIKSVSIKERLLSTLSDLVKK